MGVVYVKELWDGRSGRDGIDRRRRYSRRFEVRTDSAGDDATVAAGPLAGAMGLPRNGQPYPLDAFALVVSIDPSQSADDPTLWYVSCNYDTDFPRPQARESQGINPDTGKSEPTPQGLTERPDNPLDRPPVYKVVYEQTTEVVTHDNAGDEVLNCADDPYDPPLEIEVSRPVLTITKNMAVVQFDWLDQFVDSVNNDGDEPLPPRGPKWNGREPRTCRIVGISYEPAVENGVSFWRVVFTVKIRPKTWDRIVLEHGYREKKDVGGGVFERTDIHLGGATGIHPEKPQLLDGVRLGAVLDPATKIMDIGAVAVGNGNKTGRGKALPKDADPIYTRWRIYPEKSFSLLGL